MSNRLEHLVSKLTLNSTPLELMPNGMLDLQAMDVHAAAGDGKSRGTKNAIDCATKKGIPVLIMPVQHPDLLSNPELLSNAENR
jgi:translation elongation factor EF-Tu-like GTPase